MMHPGRTLDMLEQEGGVQFIKQLLIPHLPRDWRRRSAFNTARSMPVLHSGEQGARRRNGEEIQEYLAEQSDIVVDAQRRDPGSGLGRLKADFHTVSQAVTGVSHN